MDINEEQIKKLKELMANSAEKGNLANAAMVLDDKEVVDYSESLVVSQNDATAHAERRLVERVCRERKSNYTPNLIMITVVEPCLMCMSACSQAGYDKIAYFIPADKYADQIEWMSDVKQEVNKKRIAEKFKNPIELSHVGKYQEEFCSVFEEVMKNKIKS